MVLMETQRRRNVGPALDEVQFLLPEARIEVEVRFRLLTSAVCPTWMVGPSGASFSGTALSLAPVICRT